MLDALVAFVANPFSISMFGVMISVALLLWGLCEIMDGRRWRGSFGTLAAICMFCAAGALGFSTLKLPYCPPGEHLHGAAGRILWCAP